MNSFKYLRHQLIYLKKNASFEMTSYHENSLIKKYISDWINQGLPFIYPRQMLNDDFVDLGLTVIINNDKCRISLRVLKQAIEKDESLPKIDKIFPFFQQSLGFSFQLHFYGSFLFQYFTKQSFVNENSDLDVLLIYQNHSLLEIKKLLETLNWTSKKAIDGEVRFYGNTEAMDISIKELLTNSATLLVKTVKDTYLLSRETLYESYPSLCS
jgi:phosphoribosyl-dephospho-CoA transferase